MIDFNDEHREEEKSEQENVSLKAKIVQKDGYVQALPEINPKIENQFLKNVLAFEEAEEKHVYEILGVNPKDFPPASCLSDEELRLKFEWLIQIMSEHNFIYELAENLPISVAYRYLTEEFLYEFETVLSDGWACHVHGCGGDCPGCFQADYCEIKDEIWSKEELEAECLKRQRKNGGNELE